MTDALRACPFCGGSAAFRWTGGICIAECTKCGVSKSEDGRGDGGEAIKATARAAWNTRAALGEQGEGANVEIGDLKCIFGCDDSVFGIYSMPGGCVCHPDKVQALCGQHVLTAEPLAGGMRPIIEFGRFVRAAQAEAPNAEDTGCGMACGTCDGTGQVDSGGVQPWGEGIFVACPECQPTETKNAAHVAEESDLVGWHCRCSCGKDCETEAEWLIHLHDTIAKLSNELTALRAAPSNQALARDTGCGLCGASKGHNPGCSIPAAYGNAEMAKLSAALTEQPMIKIVPTVEAGLICPDAKEVECIANQLKQNGFAGFADEIRCLWRTYEALIAGQAVASHALAEELDRILSLHPQYTHGGEYDSDEQFESELVAFMIRNYKEILTALRSSHGS